MPPKKPPLPPEVHPTLAHPPLSAFSEPTEVDDVLVAFPAQVEHLMPAWEDIPKDYSDKETWDEFAHGWFYGKPLPLVLLKKGMSHARVTRHLRCVAGSFQPKHEHKMAAMAWLASQWLVVGT